MVPGAGVQFSCKVVIFTFYCRSKLICIHTKTTKGMLALYQVVGTHPISVVQISSANQVIKQIKMFEVKLYHFIKSKDQRTVKVKYGTKVLGIRYCAS